MNCTVHQEVPATAYCRTCGKAMCDACKRTVHGVIYCEDCLAHHVSGATVTPVAVASPVGTSPVLAAMLGFIPGVGAMYNGQFVKGLIHAGVFALLVAMQTMDIPGGLHALLGIGIGFWVIYQVIDAAKTARARLYGLPVPDPFGIERNFGGGTHPNVTPMVATAPPQGSGGYAPMQPVVPVYVPPPQERQPSPVGAVILIGLGVLFLLNTIGIWNFHWIGRMWPLVLIALGIWLFIRRFGTGQPTTNNPPEQQ